MRRHLNQILKKTETIDKIVEYQPGIVHKYAITHVKKGFVSVIQLILPIKITFNRNTVIPT